VIVVVPEHVDRIAALRGDPEDIVVVENTPVLDEIDSAAAFPVQRPDERLELVCSGGVHYYRGIDTLVDAAALLRERKGPAAHWTVVGEGKVPELRARAEQRGVGDAVEFVGFQPDLLRFIMQAHVGVVPPHRSSHYDVTMPNKLYDYMALRKPVVVSDTTPMRRVLESSDCGLVFESGNAGALADQVANLIDPERRRRYGENGRRAVEERYNWAFDARVLLTMIERVFERGTRSR
jgi:glycosyltransferase involved in cell wall biosynthesis